VANTNGSSSAGNTTTVNCGQTLRFEKPPSKVLAEKQAYAGQSIESSFEILTELGTIFDVPAKATQVVSGLRTRLDAVRAKVAGQATKNVVVAYPGMSMMNAAGIPAVMATGVTNDVIASAGGVNPFAAGGQEAANK